MKTGKNNHETGRVTMILLPNTLGAGAGMTGAKSTKEEWRQQTMRGFERLCGPADAGDEKAHERLRALEAFLRAALEYCRATERFNRASGVSDSEFGIQDSGYQSCGQA